MSDEDAEVIDRPRVSGSVDPPVKEKPEGPAWYKGTRMTVRDFLKILKGPVPIQTTGRGRGGTRRMQSMLVTGHRDGYARDSKILTYRDIKTWAVNYLELGLDEQVNVLSGTMKGRVESGWEEFAIANLSRSVSSFGTTSGTDPEIFAVNSDGEVIPAWEFLPSKDKAERIPGIGGQSNTAYWDGFQAEFTVSAAGCHQYLMDSVHSGLKAVYLAMKKKSKKAKLSLRSVVPVSGEVLAAAKKEHVEFGCAPSMNVYGLTGRTEDGRTCPFRFAGGHVHLGIPTEHRARIPDMIRAMDAISAVSCVSLFANYDSPVRRQYYGLPGEYRLPGHGLEYRTLSNAWLMHPVIAHLVFDLTRLCAFYAVAGVNAWKATQDETLEIVLNSDVEKARALLTRNKSAWISLLHSNPNYTEVSATRAFQAVMEGAESVIKDPEDIAGNWMLDGAGWVGHSNGTNKWWNGAVNTIIAGHKV